VYTFQLSWYYFQCFAPWMSHRAREGHGRRILVERSFWLCKQFCKIAFFVLYHVRKRMLRVRQLASVATLGYRLDAALMCDYGSDVHMIEARSDLHAHYKREKGVTQRNTGDRRCKRRGVTTEKIERLKTRC
jgi:hypothetical protein